MTPHPAPPRLAVWLAGVRIDAGEREFALGDLEEDFRAVAARRGARAARRWYWRQALRALAARPPARTQPDHTDGGARPSAALNALRDIGFSFRQLRRAPAASAAAIVTYALGIGANLAIFSVAWPVLVSPLPFPDEHALVHLWLTAENARGERGVNPLSPGDYHDMRTATSFTGTAAYATRVSQMNLTTGGEPRQIAVAHVTPSFFDVMGVGAIAGRTLHASDERGDRLLVVLSERTWRAIFGADPAIVGRTVRLDGAPMEVAGVVPSTAGLGTIEADAWTPLPLPDGRARTRAYYIRGVARLAPGVSRETANQELAVIMARAAADFPASNRAVSARADDFRETLTGPVRESLFALIAGAALLLIVAGINLAGLLVARTLHRAKEIGIRRALGASRPRLWSQLATEHLTLALLGGLLGVAAASMMLGTVAGLAPEGAWHPDRALPAAQVLLAALGLSLVMGLAVAALPAWRATSPARPMLSHARGSTATRATSRARAGVIAAQVALTVLLLVVAALVGSSLARVLRIDPGFAVDGRLVADVSLPRGRYDRDASVRLFEAAVERARALPGATGACAVNEMPLENGGGMTWVAQGTTRMVLATHKSVTAGCFDVLGVPLVRGRLTRTPEREQAVVLSESMARSLWADGRDPIGQQVHMGLPTGPLMTVVGVVGDIRNVTLERAAGNQVWMPHDLGYFAPSRLVVSASTPPASLAAPLGGILRDLDPELALANVRTMEDIVGKATAPRRFVLSLLGGFAVIALLLSAVGIYGVLAHAVGQRAQEIGIRRALGATTAQITRAVAGPVGVAIAAGAAAGLAGAWGVSSIVAGLLYGVSATDAGVYAAVALFVGLTATAAAWPPARRAARLDPLRALKD